MIPVLVLVLTSLCAASGRVELQAGVLRWAVSQDNSTRSVQYRVFESKEWVDLSRCSGTTADSCDVSALLKEAEHGCVRFRVRTERGEAEEACSSSEDSCTPEFSLTAAPGSITVHLTRDHALHYHYADFGHYCVRYWPQDRLQDQSRSKDCIDTTATLPLPGLDSGRTYYVDVQYVHHKSLEGAPRCPSLIQVPAASSKHTALTLGIVLPLIGLILVSVSVYVLMFQRQKIKKVQKWFRPEPEPDSLTLPLGGATVCTTPEENCSVITGFREID